MVETGGALPAGAWPLDETLLVEAGAGTGKTRALVDRLVALVLVGYPIEQIAAITFTEKAAAELRDRVREGLEAAAAAHPEEAEALEEAVRSLDRAQISTIHSFGQSLLHRFAVEAGIDPAFAVQDEVMAERRLQERWRIYLEGLSGAGAAEAAIDRALGLGLTPREMENLARELSGRAELLPLLAHIPRPPAPFWQDLQRMPAELHALPLDRVHPADQLRTKVEALMRLVEDLIRAGTDRELVLAAGARVLSQKYGNAGRAADWGPAVIKQVRDTAAGIRDRLAQTLEDCRREALAGLMPVITTFVGRDAVDRGRSGELTFDDLILRTRDLLAASGDAVRALRDAYRVLLIDEFQDTDPLQVEIAFLFARSPETGRLEAGRLFLVGDPKQSIYRFRRADMAVYARTQEEVRANGGGFPVLSRNRRSRPEVLDWVNRVFECLIGPGERPEIQPRYHPIAADDGRRIELTGPGVACFGEGVAAFAREVRSMEAAGVASVCRTILGEGWQVFDRRLGAARAASFGDIAVLIPARTVLPALERSLADARIPYRVEGGSLIYRTQEVRDLINCLTAIDDPADEVAIVGALRSPAFSCSDLEIASYRAAGGRFGYDWAGLKERDGRVAGALRSLARCHEERHNSSLAALIERFVAGHGQVETGLLEQGDRNSFRRFRFIVDQARAFEEAGPQSLRAFVQWLESRSSGQMVDKEGAGLDDDEDAVRVLTIHGAKGLEFPVAIMAGMGSSPVYRPGLYMVDHAAGEIAVCAGSNNRGRFELGPVEELRRNETEHNSAEFARMLYVAATRARDHLVFSLYHKAPGSSTASARLLEAGAAEGVRRLDTAPTAPVDREPFAGLNVELAGDAAVEAFQAARQRLVASSRQRRYTSATAEIRESKAGAEDETEPWSRGRGGTRLGRAVHAAIQSLAYDADTRTIEAFARAQAVAEGIPHRAAEVAGLVRAALESEAAGRARAAARALREAPFALRLDGLVLEGFIDLLIEGPDGLEIVDWKTDQITPEEVEARLDSYRLQAGLYALGIQAATDLPVSRITYVFVSARREISPGDPAVLAEAARLHLEARAAQAPGL
jgi:ATP-dependent helicase/nuclease subunit A